MLNMAAFKSPNSKCLLTTMIIIIITTQTYIGEVKHFPIYEDLLYKLNKHNIFKIVHFVRKDLGLQKS